MANRHGGRCSPSLIGREIRIRTTTRYRLMPVRTAKINTARNDRCRPGRGERGASHTAGGSANGCSRSANRPEGPHTVRNTTPGGASWLRRWNTQRLVSGCAFEPRVGYRDYFKKMLQKNRTTTRSSNSTVGVYPKEMKTASPEGICRPVFTAALPTAAKTQRQPRAHQGRNRDGT